MQIDRIPSAPKRRRRRDVFKPWLVEGCSFDGHMEMPVIKRTFSLPERAIPFDKGLSASDYKQWIHFYTEDTTFERIWNRPRDYIKRLEKFEGVISPDFSLYRDLPLVMQAWNTYRNRALGCFLQNHGIDVIPNVRWGDERSYDFCFDGVEKGGTVSVSTNGCIRNKADREYFKRGLTEMIKRLEPAVIVNYSYTPDDIFKLYCDSSIQIAMLSNYNDVIRKRVTV